MGKDEARMHASRRRRRTKTREGLLCFCITPSLFHPSPLKISRRAEAAVFGGGGKIPGDQEPPGL